MNQIESAMDSKIRRFLVDEGYLFPLSDTEIEAAMQELEESDITIPPHLDNPLLYLNSTPRATKKIIPMNPEGEENYLADFTALAAREGNGDIPSEILEQMKKDRENNPDE